MKRRKSKYYMETEEGLYFYDKIPDNVHITDEGLSLYTGSPVGSCWVRHKVTLYKLLHVKNDTQVIQVSNEKPNK